MKNIAVKVSAVLLALAASSAHAQWRPLPETGYWQRLMHLGEHFMGVERGWPPGSLDGMIGGYNTIDHLYEDKLAAFGGEANQMPYPGLVYQGIGYDQYDQLKWTVMDNPTPVTYPNIAPNRQ